jgi:ABC-type transport system substrate-binding protein
VRPTKGSTGRRWRSARYGTAAIAVLTLAVASACSNSPSSGSSSASSSGSASAAAAPGGSGTTTFPRNETIYTSGTAYSAPSNWNPLDLGNYATGTQGLIYEPLYLYDPIKGAYDPWLATGDLASGWKGDTYVINVRLERRHRAHRRRRRLLDQPGADKRHRPVLGQRRDRGERHR